MLYRVGEFAKLSGITADALRHYQKVGLLQPEEVDRGSGYRYYGAHQLLRVNTILALKDAGFSLGEMRPFLEEGVSIHKTVGLLQDRASLLRQDLQQRQDRLTRLQTNIFMIQNGGMPQMGDVTVKQVEEMLVVGMRRRFGQEDFDQNLEEMWAAVNGMIEKMNGQKTVPCLMLYHMGWWNMAATGELDVEVAEPVAAGTMKEGEGGRVYKLPAEKKVACLVHVGSFKTISSAFEKLFAWVKANGYVASGPLREIYHKGEWAAESPDEYVTELQLPVR